MKRLLLGILISTALFVSCNDDEGDTITDVTKITSNNWKLSAWTITYEIGSSSTTSDIFKNPGIVGIDSCVIDDLLTFYTKNTGNTYLTQPGAITCQLSQSMFGNGEWQFLGDTLSLEPYGNFPAQNFKLLDLSGEQLKISRTIELSVNKSGITKIDTKKAGSIEALEVFTYVH